MMPSIRVEDDVYTGLQKLAEPFVDTPNTVIRKLLEEKGVLSQRRQETSEVRNAGSRGASGKTSVASRGSLTPQQIFEEWLLHTLYHRFGGEADKATVTKAMIEAMRARGLLTDADMERVSTGETKAENTIAWGRNRLKEAGLISRISPRGIWQLTPAGKERAKKIVFA